MANYTLTIKKKTFGRYNEKTERYDITTVETPFKCESLDQLVGLLQFMVATSEDELDLTIARMEDDND